MDKMYFTPAEIAQNYVDIAYNKAHAPVMRQILLSILAGAFIAFAAEGSNTAIHTIQSVGLGKALAGALFATGLMLVIVAGAELFTGNTLIVFACLEKRVPWLTLLKSWIIVYSGNFIGSVLIVMLILQSGQLDFSGGMLGGFTVKLAAYKTGLSFSRAFAMGILCNWLVCLAVWMASAAKDIAGKLLAIFFPIWLFITSGFEHSIANMYYIPAGIMAKANQVYVDQAIALGAKQSAIDGLNWTTLFTKNLIPVTLGNIVGGAFFVGFFYWAAYANKKATPAPVASAGKAAVKATAKAARSGKGSVSARG